METNQEESLIRYVSSLKGASFCSIKNYQNNKGELSNYVINVAVNYCRMKERDIKILESIKFEDPLKDKIRRKMLTAAILNKNKKTANNKSTAQREGYLNVSDAIRVNLKTGRVFIYGQIISKKIIDSVQLKSINSRITTILKKEIEDELNLSCPKFRQFAFDKLSLVKCGQTFTIKSNILEINFV